MTKYLCGDCEEPVDSTDMLRAQNPFNPDDGIVGCPHCKEVNTMIRACDEPGCRERSTCGTPTPNGYRSTCGRHKPS